jgi:hypothetical protein
MILEFCYFFPVLWIRIRLHLFLNYWIRIRHYLYGSGSFHQQAKSKKYYDFYYFVTSFGLFLWRSVPSKSKYRNKQKKI